MTMGDSGEGTGSDEGIVGVRGDKSSRGAIGRLASEMYTSAVSQALKQERDREKCAVIEKFRAEQEREPSIKIGQSEKFVVVYRDAPKIYESFGAWIDTDPSALAEYLEQRLAALAEHFRVTVPNRFYVVEVIKGAMFKVLYRSGENMWNVSRHHFPESDGVKFWDYANFSKVYSRWSYTDKKGKPNIYKVAVHEALGHGFIEKELIPDDTPEIHFLIEGLASYVQYAGAGLNPHDYFREILVILAEGHFSSLFYGWVLDRDSPKEITKKMREQDPIFGSLMDAFFLDGPKSNIFGAGMFKKTGDYPRGCSFVKYLIDSYGVDMFKDWIYQVTRENFFSSLELMTRKSMPVIEEEWKQEVLNREFLECDDASKQRGWTEDEKLERRKRLEQIRRAFLRFSYPFSGV